MTFALQFLTLIALLAPPARSEMTYVEMRDANGVSRRFSRLVMGTDHLVQGGWTHGSQPAMSEEQAFRVLDEAARHGINFFDTAPIYVGDVEHRLGKWRRTRADSARERDFYAGSDLNPDRKLYVLSKGGFPFDLYWAQRLADGSHSPELLQELRRRGILGAEGGPLNQVPPGTYASRLHGDPAQITERIAEELGHTSRNLDGDIAMYLMHRDDGDAVAFDPVKRRKAPVKDIMEALGAAGIRNQFGLLGWSNWEPARIRESLQLAKANPALPRPALNSPYFSLFEMSERTIHALGVQVTHREMMDPGFQRGIKIMPYSPLGGFSILDQPEPRWENAKQAAKLKYEQGDPYWRNVFPSIFTEANEARWHRVVAFTEAFNRERGTRYTVDQMINAYALAHPRTDLLAIGAITVEQVQRTVGALELSKQLTPEDLEFLYSGSRVMPSQSCNELLAALAPRA